MKKEKNIKENSQFSTLHSPLKEGWELKKLGEVADVEYGYTDKSTEKGHFRYVRITDIDSNGELIATEKKYIQFSEEAKNFLIEKNDLLMARTGATFAKVLLFNDVEPSVFASYLIRIKFKVEFENKLYWYFSKSKSYWEQANKLQTGAAQPHFNGAALKKIEFAFPKSLTEQQRIVAYLDQTFKSIENAKLKIEKNLQNAKELFETELRNVFENKGDDWEEKSLGEVAEYDKTPNKRNDLLYVGLEDIESNTGRFIGSENQKLVKSTTFFFNENHILYGRLRPYLNKVLLPNFEGHCSTEIFPILPKNKLVKREYLFWWLISNNTMNKINETWTGAVLPRANMNTVLNFKLFVPNLQTQQEIVAKLDALKTQTQQLESVYQTKLNNIEELYSGILKRAFETQLTEA